MLDTALVLLVIAGLLIVVGLSQPLAARLRLPQTAVLAAVGIGIGALPQLTVQLNLSHSVDAAAEMFADLPVNSVIFVYVFLPLLVFEAGIATDVKRIVEDAAAILLLAVVATLITAAAVGLALWPFAHFPMVVCLLRRLHCRHHRPGGGDRHISRRRRATAIDPAGGRRIAPQ